MLFTTNNNSARLATVLLTLTLTLLVTSANGFNVLRHGSQRQLSAGEVHGRPKRSAQTGASRFVIVLDAGSSSTKASVYEFAEQEHAGALPGSVREVSTGEIKIKPALDTFADKSVEDLRNYFSGVFASLASKVSQPSETSLYLLATAGMRQLRREDAEKARRLMGSVQSVLSDAALNPYSFAEDHVRVLSGTEEGIYAWMAANFLNGFFHSVALNRDDSVGVLEMGGSSLQTAYMLPGPSLLGCKVQVDSDSRYAKIYVKSYAGFGASGIVEQVLETACGAGGEGGSRVVQNPCLLTGDSAQVACDGADQEVAVDGTGSPQQCQSMLEDIVDRSVNDQPAGSQLFYAIGAFRHSLKTLNAVDSETDVLDVDLLRQTAKLYCQMSWEEAANYKGSKKFVSDDCIQGLFTEELLDSLDLDDNTIKVSQEINGKRISWALGAALDLSTQDISVRCPVNN